VVSIPHVPRLKEGKVRKGYFGHHNVKMRDVLPDCVKAVLTMGYHTGMRRGEILSLVWDNMNIF